MRRSPVGVSPIGCMPSTASSQSLSSLGMCQIPAMRSPPETTLPPDDEPDRVAGELKSGRGRAMHSAAQFFT